MENAVKALLMAAGVLIGVLILTLGVILYTSLSNYTEQIREKIEENAINKFNAQFTGFVRNDLTIQDIVTVANIAYENNLNYNLDASSADENPYYVQVILKDDSGERSIEQTINIDATTLLKDNLKDTFKCENSYIKFSKVTGRVMSIKFEKN